MARGEPTHTILPSIWPTSIVFISMPTMPIAPTVSSLHPVQVPTKRSTPTTRAIRIAQEKIGPRTAQPTPIRTLLGQPLQDEITILSEPAKPEPDVSSMLERAREQAREIGREPLPKSQNEIKFSRQELLARAIGAAFKQRNTTIEEIHSPDGIVISKVRGPLGTYCIMRESNGPGGGRDPFRSSPRDKMVTCPN
jgi:hypothetical protein